jgi:uncharacterized protein (DUF1800 family)
MIKPTDPRQHERKIWIDQFRKVKPQANPTGQINSVAGSSGRRNPLNTGLDTYTGSWANRNIAHLLRRCLFGVTKKDLREFQSITLEQCVDKLLNTSPTPTPPVNDYSVDEQTKDPNVAFGESWLDAPQAGNPEGNRLICLKSWHIRNIIRQEATIHEKMIFFWHNLLPTLSWDVFIAKTSFVYGSMLRANALGNYKTLIKQLSIDPAMLIFLNGTFNNKEAPDENYGRELQELFCIGKSPESKYTEGDVHAAARVLTGWAVTWPMFHEIGQFSSFFDPDAHDTEPKQFSSFYDDKVIEGKPGDQGAEELDELLDMLIGHEECARYICRRLYNFFVYNDIDEKTESEIIRPLAVIFRENNFEIVPVLKKLFMSAHFHDENNHGAIIKSPLDHAVGLWRSLNVKSPDENDLNLNFKIHSNLLWHMASLGLEYGDPPNVAGWPAYYQAPVYDKSWMTSSTITTRAQLTDALLYSGFWISTEMQINADIISFVKDLDNPEDPIALIQESAVILMGFPLTESEINNLKSILLSGQSTDAYWTLAWNTYLDDPGNEENKLVVETRLRATFQRILQAGEYHLM